MQTRDIVKAITVLGLAGAGIYGLMAYNARYKCETIGEIECTEDGYRRKCVGFPSDDVPLVKYWYTSEERCVPQPCKEGATKCQDGHVATCTNGVYVKGLSECNNTLGDPCSVPGSAYCKDGKYFVCQGDGTSREAGTCSDENCNAVACGSGNFACGGFEPDDEDDYYYDFRCDPVNFRCNPMNVTRDSPVCKARPPEFIEVVINNQASMLNGLPVPIDLYVVGNCGGWPVATQQTESALIEVTVRDNTGRPLAGADLEIIALSPKWGGFVNPVDDDDHYINCVSAKGISGVDGKAVAKWVWTYVGGALGNDQTLEFKAIAKKNGGTVEQRFKLHIHGSALVGGWTCDGVKYGSVCKP